MIITTLIKYYYRYSFAYTAKPERIYPNKKWLQAQEEKTITEVLLKKNFEFVAFGYEARNIFLSATADYLLFSTFKMVLHNKVF